MIYDVDFSESWFRKWCCVIIFLLRGGSSVEEHLNEEAKGSTPFRSTTLYFLRATAEGFYVAVYWRESNLWDFLRLNL
jgi:hypothetical protein